MPGHEALLIRTAALLQATRQLIRESCDGRDLDCNCLEKSAIAINDSQFLISETDKVIRQSGAGLMARSSH